MRVQGKYLLVGFLLLLSAGLAYDSLSKYMNPYLSVSLVVSRCADYEGRNVQVMGVVAPGSVQRGGLGPVVFSITDGFESLDVSYAGALPQNFDQGKDVVVLGTLSRAGALEASTILVKCPSKYVEGEAPRTNYHIFVATLLITLGALAYLGVSVLRRG